MTRPRVVLGPSGAYWVKAETSKAMPYLGAPWSADLLVTTLAYFRHALGFRLYAFSIVPTSFEAVIQPHGGTSTRIGSAREQTATISKIMMEVKGSFAHWYNRRLGRSGSVWEKRFKDRILLTSDEIRGAARSVHAVPVLLGLGESPEDYPYSGLAISRHPIQVIDHLPVETGQMPVPVSARERVA